MPIGISSNKSEYWHNKSRALIRDILNSSQGLKPSDNTRKAVFSRIVDNYRVLNGIVFVGIVGIEQNHQEREENRIIKVLSILGSYQLLVHGTTYIKMIRQLLTRLFFFQ